MSLYKKIKPVSDYQVWVYSGYASDGFLDGDILAVSESLGHRAARSVTIENRAGGTAVVRFNVVQKLYKPNQFFNPIFKELTSVAPIEVGEVELVKPDIELADGVSMNFPHTEIAVSDIKVVTVTSGLRIIVT